MKRTKSVEEYIENSPWRKELELLRKLMRETEMEETVKWGAPTYTVNGKNVIGLGAFKSYVGLWFHQGRFLKDGADKLLNAQEGVTKSLRQWRFDSLEEIQAEADNIRAYVHEAILNQKAGKEVKAVKAKSVEMPEELQSALDGNADLKNAYEALTPGRQREYAEYIGTAKRAETRASRLEKVTPMILDGIGLNDKYR